MRQATEASSRVGHANGGGTEEHGQETLAVHRMTHLLLERSMLLQLEPKDRARARILIPAAFAIVGEMSWTARDLYAKAALKEADPNRGCAAAAIRGLASEMEGAGSSEAGLRPFGHLLARLACIVVDGIELVNLDHHTRDGALYKVARLRV